jgi:hypothetical protein
LWDALYVQEVVDNTSGQPVPGRSGKPKLRKSWIAAPLFGLMRYCDREGIAPTAD